MNNTVVIASVLKPVDDIRAYEKIAQSIAKTNKYEVNIIGNVGKKESNYERITFYPHQISRESTIKRLLLRTRILFLILKLKPQLLIITTHELLNITLFTKILTGCKVVYDVQENYVANINHINPTLFRQLYSSVIKLKEFLSKSYVSEYWLAEACYASELRFVKDRFSVIENKAKKEPIHRSKSKELSLLFSGTISDYGGVKNAVNLFTEIKKIRPSTSLKIIGQIHDSELEKYLQKKQLEIENIELMISHSSIPHDQIIEAIFNSSLGIIGYEENEVNQYKIPTKLFEYSRYQLPYLVAENTHWSAIGSQLGGAIHTNFHNPDIDQILDLVTNPQKLFSDLYHHEATWEFESQKIIESIKTLIR